MEQEDDKKVLTRVLSKAEDEKRNLTHALEIFDTEHSVTLYNSRLLTQRFIESSDMLSKMPVFTEDLFYTDHLPRFIHRLKRYTNEMSLKREKLDGNLKEISSRLETVANLFGVKGYTSIVVSPAPTQVYENEEEEKEEEKAEEKVEPEKVTEQQQEPTVSVEVVIPPAPVPVENHSVKPPLLIPVQQQQASSSSSSQPQPEEKQDDPPSPKHLQPNHTDLREEGWDDEPDRSHLTGFDQYLWPTQNSVAIPSQVIVVPSQPTENGNRSSNHLPRQNTLGSIGERSTRGDDEVSSLTTTYNYITEAPNTDLLADQHDSYYESGDEDGNDEDDGFIPSHIDPVTGAIIPGIVPTVPMMIEEHKNYVPPEQPPTKKRSSSSSTTTEKRERASSKKKSKVMTPVAATAADAQLISDPSVMTFIAALPGSTERDDNWSWEQKKRFVGICMRYIKSRQKLKDYPSDNKETYTVFLQSVHSFYFWAGVNEKDEPSKKASDFKSRFPKEFHGKTAKQILASFVRNESLK